MENMNILPLLALQTCYYARKNAKKSKCIRCKYFKGEYDECKNGHKPYEYRDYCSYF